MPTASISPYSLQVTAVAIILTGCLAWMFLSIRRRFKSKSPSHSCTGCGLTDICAKNRRAKTIDCNDHAGHTSTRKSGIREV